MIYKIYFLNIIGIYDMFYEDEIEEEDDLLEYEW